MPSRSFIIRTKLRPPRRPADLVARPELVQRLDADRHRFALIAAPAGYGKSTLLGLWSEAWTGSAAWLSLDEGDNDPAVFLAHLAAALDRASPGDFELLTELGGSAEAPSPRLLAGVLGNEVLDLEQPVLLVLDDYQSITTPLIHEFLDELLAQRPEGLTLAIGTRRDPPLRLGALRAAADVLEVRAEDLRLDAAQSGELLAQVSGSRPPDDVVESLHREHEGWPAGLRLVGLAHRDRSWEAEGTSPAADRVSLDLLVEEVLDGFSDEFGERLRALSIFERFTPALIDYVLGAEPGTGAHLVERMEQENLFISRLSGHTTNWLRMHGLIRELLRRELEEDSDRAADLNRRAARWFAEHGLIEEALLHARRCGDTDLATEIVVGSRGVISSTEQWSRLERWLSVLPDAAIHADPELLILAAWSADNRGLHRLMATRLDRLEAVVDAIDDPSRRDAIRGEAAGLRSVQYYQEERGQEALDATAEALRLLPLEREGEQAYAGIVRSMALQMVGDFPGAQAEIDRMLDGAHGSGTFQTRILMARAFVQWIEGDTTGAAETARVIANLAHEHGLGESAAAAAMFSGMASLDQRDFAAAAAAVRPTIHGAYAPNAFFYGHSAMVLALALQGLGREDEARSVVADVLARRLAGANPLGAAEVEAFAAELALRQGRVEDAQRWHEQYQPGSCGVAYGAYHPELTRLRYLLLSGDASADDVAVELIDRFRASHNVRLERAVEVLRRSRGAPEAAGEVGRGSEAGSTEREISGRSAGGTGGGLSSLSSREIDIL
jgi:LuxR family maltose regulon positive regulatory protein